MEKVVKKQAIDQGKAPEMARIDYVQQKSAPFELEKGEEERVFGDNQK